MANEEPPVGVDNILVHPGDVLEVSPGGDRLNRTVRLKLRDRRGVSVAVLECERVPPDGMRVVSILVSDELRAILRPGSSTPGARPALGSPDREG
jgi:hypothetical protein